MEKKYYKHKIENLININKIITIHYFEFDKNFVSKEELHDFWELIYVIKNNTICHIEKNAINLQCGQLLLLKPNVKHYIKSDGKSESNIFIISFTTKNEAIHFFENKIINLDKNLEKYIFSIIEESKNTFDIPISSPYIKKMELKKDRALGGLQIIKNNFEILLINIIRKENNEKSPVFLIRENYKNNISGEIIKYLNENIYDNISIEQLTNIFHYSKSYLFRCFKKETGQSIMQYFTLLKIEKAKDLLTQTTKSINEIADSLSFDTPSYFCMVFKNIVKISPLKYRKNNL